MVVQCTDCDHVVKSTNPLWFIGGSTLPGSFTEVRSVVKAMVGLFSRHRIIMPPFHATFTASISQVLEHSKRQWLASFGMSRASLMESHFPLSLVCLSLLSGALILSYLSFDIRQDASFTKARFAEHSTSIFFLKQLSRSESWGITSSIIVQFATKRFV